MSTPPFKPGPPFDQQQAPYEPFPTLAQSDLDATPKQPNFDTDKQFYSAGYPVHMTRSSGLLKRSEPILTPELLVSRYLKSIPLAFPNGDHYTADDIKDQINIATNELEILCKITVTREQFTDKLPYDASLYKSYIYMKTEQNPILAVQDVSIVSSDGYRLFKIPAQWIEPSGFSKGIVNIVPLLGSYSVPTGGGIGAYYGVPYLSVFQQLTFMPGFWQITYQTGTSKIEGQYPVVINDLIGTIASINMLSAITNMFLTTSQSLSRDGISQSSSGPGNRMYLPYIEQLEKKKAELVQKIKATFSTKMIVSNL